MVWAGRDGTIGWQSVGIAPIRRSWSGLVPVPGDGRYEWDGYLPLIAKPHVVDPPEGYFATANNDLIPRDYEYMDAVGFSWSDPYRWLRIVEVLGGGTRFSIADMMRLQTDELSVPARQLVPMLEELMASEDREEKAGLDAIIGAYLTLRGEEGMKRVEELYLKNEEAEYVDTYAAVMAIRILGQESDVIPRDRLVEALRHVLDRAEYADLVIRDLARWEDWTVLDKLVEMFRKAEGPTIWIRDPVVQYVQVAMEEEGKVGQRATEAFAELKEIDAKAVERATAYGPAAMFAQSRASEADPPATGADGPAGDEVVEGSTDDAEQASTDDSPTEVAAVDTNDEAAAPNEGEATERADGDDGATAAIDEVPPTDTAEEGFLTSTVGVAAMIVVVAIVIFAMIWFLLRGFGRTSAPTARTGEPVS